MKKLLPLLALLFFPSLAHAQPGIVGPPNGILCNKVAQVGPTNASSNFTAVTSVSGQTIYLCGWHVTATSAGAVYFQIGQGNCTFATAYSSITPSLSVTSTAPATDHQSFATTQTSQASQLCFGVGSSTSSLSAAIFYAQY